MRRPWPKSLAGQMIALLLLALIVAQAIGVAIFFDERRGAVRAVTRGQILSRTASIVRLLNDTPPVLHGRIIESAGTRRLHFELAETSFIPAGAPPSQAEFLHERLARLLGDQAREVRIAVQEEDRFPFWRGRGRFGPFRYDDDDDDHHMERRYGPFAGRHRHFPSQGLKISVLTRGGPWLNVATLIPTRDPEWRFSGHFSLGFAALALVLIVIFMVRRVTRPLRALAGAADRLGRGEETEPVAERGPEDVKAAIRAFNRMQARLGRFVADRTRMMAAISHDLRTPITSLRLRAELIEDPETKARMIETLDEMQALTEATLAFVREEASREDTRTVDLTALIDSLVQDFADMGKAVTFAEAPRIAYACRPVGLKRALRNLIDNAVTHGGSARVALDTDEEHAIVIDDDGPGIPEADLERVFEPFVRMEESRSRETGGIGLGLAIARSLIRAHGGDITLANRDGGGLRVTVRLPWGDDNG